MSDDEVCHNSKSFGSLGLLVVAGDERKHKSGFVLVVVEFTRIQ